MGEKVKTIYHWKGKKLMKFKSTGHFRSKRAFWLWEFFFIVLLEYFVCFLRMRNTLGCEPIIRANKKIKLKNPEQGGNDWWSHICQEGESEIWNQETHKNMWLWARRWAQHPLSMRKGSREMLIYSRCGVRLTTDRSPNILS